jgi:hypothetical protein
MHQRRPQAARQAPTPLQPWVAVVSSVNPGPTWHQGTAEGKPVMQLVGRFTVTNLTSDPLRIVRVDVVNAQGDQLAETGLLVDLGGHHSKQDLPPADPANAMFCALCSMQVPVGSDYAGIARLTDERGRILEVPLKFRYM